MSAQLLRNAALVCHSSTPDRFVRSVGARVSVEDDGRIALHFFLEGEIACLRIPPAAPPRRADKLWQHSCFEAFVALNDEPAYHEFNFSPSREWAAYTFSRYREAAPDAVKIPVPDIVVRSTADQLELGALIRLDRQIPPGTHLRLALSAVIEDGNGAISYWALRHPAGKPDFHHAEGFALEITC